MRALSVLIVFVLGFVLVLKFYPRSDEVRGSEPPRTEPAARPESPAGTEQVAERVPEAPPSEARFLDRPGSSDPARLAETATPVAEDPSGDRAGRQETPAGSGRPAWLDEVEARNDSRALVGVGAALVHGGPPELESELAKLNGQVPAAVADALRGFAQALEGRRDRAMALMEGVSFEELPPSFERALRLALGAEEGQAPPLRAARREGVLELAMAMALRAHEASLALETGRAPEAARAFSELLLTELESPWEADSSVLASWSDSLARAQARHRWNAEGSWNHVTVEVEPGDSLTTIRARYLADHPGRRICTGLIEKANGIEGYIHPGQKLRIPTDEVSVLADLSARWILYLHGDEVAAAWPVGVGRDGEETITGSFVAGEKQENPMWWPKGKDPVPFGDPRNPLGTRWIGWMRGDENTAYGFHGTNQPESIGKAASDGCIRMRNESVELLYEILPVGAPILVRE